MIMTKSQIRVVIHSILILHLFSCSQPNEEMCSFKALIEIPAGTHTKFEYNKASKKFECEIINGKKRKINYLSYLGNYGFILDTYMNPLKGGDGDPLDVIVLSDPKKQGSQICIKPIAILKLKDNGENDHKIIATDLNSDIPFTYESLPESIKEILKIWFCNYKGIDKVKFISWGNKEEAIKEIQKWKF